MIALLDPAAAAAGDIARRLQLLPDAEWLEVALLRIVPVGKFLALDEPPRARELGGDVGRWLGVDHFAYGPFTHSWPSVLSELAVQQRLEPFRLERADRWQRNFVEYEMGRVLA